MKSLVDNPFPAILSTLLASILPSPSSMLPIDFTLPFLVIKKIVEGVCAEPYPISKILLGSFTLYLPIAN